MADFILDIEPIKDTGQKNCIDYLIESVANWKKYDYRIMYIDAWRFRFVPEKIEREGIWKRGEIASYLYYEDKLETFSNLSTFVGITIRWYENYPLDRIEKTIKAGFPVILFCDTFHISWLEEFYEKVHSEHSILLVGCNDAGFYCNDTRPFSQIPIEKGFLSKEQLAKAYLGQCGFFQFEEKKVSRKNIFNVLGTVDTCMFSQMEAFAEYIKGRTISREDLEGFGGNEGILLRAIRNIIRSRRNYLLALESISNQYHISFGSVREPLEHSIEAWGLVKTLFCKEYIENNFNKYHYKISELIYSSRNFEMKAYENLINIIKMENTQ